MVIDIERLQSRRAELVKKITEASQRLMQKGVLYEQYRRCGKCKRCRADPQAQPHGPYLILHYVDSNGWATSRAVARDQEATVREQIGWHRDFEYRSRDLLKIDQQLLEATHAEAKAERQRKAKAKRAQLKISGSLSRSRSRKESTS